MQPVLRTSKSLINVVERKVAPTVGPHLASMPQVGHPIVMMVLGCSIAIVQASVTQIFITYLLELNRMCHWTTCMNHRKLCGETECLSFGINITCIGWNGAVTFLCLMEELVTVLDIDPYYH